MKTTVEIRDSILKEAKKIASKEDITFRELVEEGLRRTIADRQKKRPFKLKGVVFKGKGKGLHPDIEEGNWEQIRSLIYEGRGG